MPIEYVPLLRTQRDLYDLPRGRERFEHYLRTMLDDDRDDVRTPPLVAINPMAREHVAALLDELLALDADGLAARALSGVDGPDGRYKVGLVVADDARGGWTNRWSTEFSHAFESAPVLRRGWVTALLWSSEPASTRSAIEAVLTAVHRVAHVERHGPAKTLRERMAQEGYAMARAGCSAPTLDPDDLAYTREVIAPLFDETDRRACMECLYGDDAGRTLGFAPRGLSDRAGLALALADARAVIARG